MAKDRIVIRMIFSGALIVFGIGHMLYTAFSRILNKAKIKKDLRHIKHYDIQKIVEESFKSSVDAPEGDAIKKEVDTLLKDIYFNLYNQHKNTQEIQDNYSDMELSIDHVLDNNILNIIEEKDKLLQEKDRMIVMLEEKNEKFINETIAKITYIVQVKDKFIAEKEQMIRCQAEKIGELEKGSNNEKFGFIIQEKDKLLREKDAIINTLYKKLQGEENIQQKNVSHLSSFSKGGGQRPEDFVTQPVKQDAKPKYYYSENFVNVNG